MTETKTIIESFVKNFVQKDKAERVLFELSNPKKRSKFTNRLNHNWEQVLDMRCLTEIDKKNDYPEKIKELWRFGGGEMCYVISNYDDFDGKFLPFCEIIEKLYAKGFASLFIDTAADKLFLITEQVQGPAPKFIGKKK